MRMLIISKRVVSHAQVIVHFQTYSKVWELDTCMEKLEKCLPNVSLNLFIKLDNYYAVRKDLLFIDP